MVANHLAELAGQRAYATLTGRLSAIAQAHALLRLPFDKQDPELRKTLQGIARTHGTRPERRAAPLLTQDVIRVASACGGSLRGERDRALLLLGFAGAFRRSELVQIRVGDLTFGQHGLSVLLSRSKADQLGEGTIVHVAANPLTALRGADYGVLVPAVGGSTV
jgi:integrase